MRRSQAPSMRKAVKRGVPALQDDDVVSSSPPIEWGTSGKSYQSGPRQLKADENPLRDSRIFHVLWRNPSTRKHKIWTGNGTLVVTGSKATLKDEAGKVLGTFTSFRPEQIRENEQLEINSKEVEIQEELTTVEECVAVRNQEMANWCRKIDEENGHLISPCIDVSRPQRPIMLKRRGIPNLFSTKSSPSFSKTEYVCLLSPAELQSQILEVLAKSAISSSLDILEPIICDHPVLLRNQLNQYPRLSEFLPSHLQEWQEMGLYDSAKFEFVHLMLDELVVGRNQKCVIVANTQNCLELIKGYCQTWDISYIQIEEAEQASHFNSVALLRTESLLQLEPLSLHSETLILYNFEARDKAQKVLAKEANTQIFTLITAGCVEEPGILESAIDANWNHIKPPFNEEFLKTACLNDKLNLLDSVYTVQT